MHKIKDWPIKERGDCWEIKVEGLNILVRFENKLLSIVVNEVYESVIEFDEDAMLQSEKEELFKKALFDAVRVEMKYRARARR